MRVLWFTVTSGNYHSDRTGGYDGGGWIRSLQSVLSQKTDIQLGVAFHMEGEPKKVEIDGVTYYPMSYPKKNIKEKIRSAVKWKDISVEKYIWNDYVEIFKDVIDDFNPDIIELFGTEFHYGLVAEYIDIPCVVHIQGIISPNLNAFFPPNFSLSDYCFRDVNPKHIYQNYQSYIWYRRQAYRERYIYKHINNYMGRTEWDRIITSIFNPKANYFNCGEILRDVFYEDSERVIPKSLTIVSTISAPLSKGYDMILKTANILHSIMGVNFKWEVFGNVDAKFQEKITGINHEKVNIELKGSVSAICLKEHILHSTCYFHPSYIDNSPNSVCEAQILGCPVIVTNVGGESSLVEHGVTGYLVPANDPFMASYYINKLFSNIEINKKIGMNAKIVAMRRHDRNQILEELIDNYNKILNLD